MKLVEILSQDGCLINGPYIALRYMLGIGLGDTGESVGSDISFTHFKEMERAEERAHVLDEALEMLRGLWSGEPFHYKGQYYQVKEVTFLPRPV